MGTRLSTDSVKLKTRWRPLALVVTVVGAVLAMFQNCGTYEPMRPDTDVDQLASSCLGASCLQDLNYLNINIANQDPILIQRDVERAIDLSGYCDTAGYPNSKIYIELKSGATSVISPYLSPSKCDVNGRFRVRVDLPVAYNYNLAYTIVLTFRAVDSAGLEYDHPTGINRREVTVLTAP